MHILLTHVFRVSQLEMSFIYEKNYYFIEVMNKIVSQNPNKDQNTDQQGSVLLEAKPKLKKPSMYNVLLLNDDYTPMEFVVLVLEKIFNKKQEEATQIMLHVHKNGVGICGTFTFEVAETKCKLVIDMAKKNQHPLQCTIEKS